ncbi:hypothetical protein K474DRAFT_651604 [Panus rudis PR-1116 ss-1]|nr:hypothetical protein K474DRAFT_651604 [Panus rudis PR-1116 ss-1]
MSQTEGHSSYSAGQLTGIPMPLTSPSFPSFGWIEYSLPDNTVYYANASMGAVTDMNLRDMLTLHSMTKFFQQGIMEDKTVGSGKWEMWVRHLVDDGERSPENVWVNHEDWTVLPASDAPAAYREDKNIPKNDTLTDDGRVSRSL